MTNVPTDLATFRTGVVIQMTGLSGNDVGIAPDASHLAGGGYHCGCEDIQSISRWNIDYSTRQARDRLTGTNLASAMDIGDDWPHGGRAAWLRFNNLLVAQLQAADPALTALRAVNFSPDGTARRRYDSFNPTQGVIDSTDSVYMHTHLEWWRDTAGTSARARSLARVGQIIDAAVRNVPLGDEMEQTEQVVGVLSRGNRVGDVFADTTNERDWWYSTPDKVGSKNPPPAGSRADLLVKAAQKLLGAPAAVELTDEQASALADKVAAAVAAHPDNPLGDADKPVIVAAVKQALAEGVGSA